MHPAMNGFPVAWFAPTNKNLAESWELAKRTFLSAQSRRQEDKHIIELVGGGKVEMWSLEDPDSSRGRKYKLAVIDEAAHVRHLEYAWTQVIRQRLTDYEGGAWFLSTPFGLNYFKTLYDRGADTLSEEWRSWRMPTGSNPFIKASEIESARRDMSDLAFSQEYEAQFVSWEGAVFRRITDAVSADLPCEPEPDHVYVIGVDWGQKNDFNVFAVIDATAKKLALLDRTRGLPYTLQKERLAAMKEKWNDASVLAEENSIGGPIIEDLNKSGVKVKPFTTTNETKAAIIEQLALDFERGMIQIPNDPVLIAELQAFECSATRTGLKYYGGPKGGHDDTVIALAIGWAGAAKATKKTTIIIGGVTKESIWRNMSG